LTIAGGFRGVNAVVLKSLFVQKNNGVLDLQENAIFLLKTWPKSPKCFLYD
jgi:hypothetical protein